MIVCTIQYLNTLDQVRINVLQTTQVDPILIWIRASLVMGVNTANLAEIMLCFHRVELIKPQTVFPFDNPEIGQGYGSHDSALPATNRTIASSRIHYTFG